MRTRILRFVAGSIVVLLLVGWIALHFVPIPSALLRTPVQSIALVDRNGIPLRETRVEERFSRELTRSQIPPHVVAAILAAAMGIFRVYTQHRDNLEAARV